MPAKAYSLGEWTPDLAADSKHLSVAQNVRAIANGYAPMPAFSAITPTLGGTFVGGGAFVESEGTAHALAARADALRIYSGGAWSDVLTGLATTERWYGTQFGDRVIWANGGPLLRYVMSTGVADEIPGAPNNAIDACTVGDFAVVLLDDNNVAWSEYNNSDGWTYGDNQSDIQPLLDGGAGMRLAGSNESALILQKGAIRRMRFVGGDVVFQIDVVSREIGCMARGSVCNVGRLTFFLSERGFQMCNGEEVTPISDEKFNRWFFGEYSREDIQNIWAAIDPQSPVVYWGMPGTPGLLLCYNWVLQRGYTAEVDVSGIYQGVTANVSIDALDAIFGHIDAIPVSLDDPAFRGGNPLILLVNGSNEVGTLAGDNLEATIEIPAVEPAPGKRSRIRSIRPITDASTATVTVNARLHRSGGEAMVSAASLRANGKAPIRSNGRYNDIRVVIPAGTAWTDIQGCEVEFEAGDGR
jgi:hypothetical protein